MRVRLGHITYSNCFPVHAGVIDRGAPEWLEVVEGIPSDLNARLARGEIDVAPCSSIEFARHAGVYRILPDLVIGARGAVRSILLLSRRPAAELGGCRVGLPTASATSVVLLRILLRARWGAEPEFFWFDQARENPLTAGADAALFIGDIALRPGLHPSLPYRYDLGEEWWLHTELPFAFAIWQTGGGAPDRLRALHTLLLESRRYGGANRSDLAHRYAAHFGIPAPLLEAYWEGLSYDLDSEMLEGLRAFYRLAVEAGELGAEPALRWME